ncbi:unnamed protein product, partial [Prorocentrum cordatum]
LKPPRRISGRGTGQLESTARHPNGGHGMGQSALSRTAEATTVSTLAGSDASGYADGQGAAASFYRPTGGVAVDGAGNVFVAGKFNYRIQKISAGGAVSTLAGSGDEGYADGQGAAASFWCPAGVAVDGAGNVFVADCYNHRIRKISAGGAVSTLAGSGVSGSSFAHPAFTAHFHRFIGTEQAVDFPQLKHAKCIWEGIIQGFGIECAGKSQERGLRGICRTGVVASVRFDSYAQGSGSSKAAAAHEVH